MRLQADVPVADIILSVVGRRFFSFEPKPDSTSFPQSSCSVKNKPIAKGQKPKEDEKVKSDSQVTSKGFWKTKERIVFAPGNALGGHLCK